MYEDFAAWLDEKLENGLPDTTAAVNFNIYEEENNGWTVQLIASDRFDAGDDEWACFEVYSSGEDLYYREKECGWEEIHEDVREMVQTYLEKGRFADMLKSFRAVGFGFVDGDLELAYVRE
ncbi:hypothetical protein [Ruminococcus sp.]|uniref:hypothetical protein n=1 Tax=Ruminococcus sp. TaxID=41978 RepID=UPI0025EC275B|nr:hypothetical protein [Ruminococcus sp.]MBQ8967015.1 hypothetical protein [Ruminococcus sp.]